ncbi:MAG: winged helix-turn-helix domain-containing protein [Bryobacteraceae bacterium]|jgi:DNA-binding winged helix-turn-helix (wHTH) protein/Tol biopolymer transport system component
MVAPARDKSPRRVRFGVFEVDLQHGELHKNGHKIKLQDLPFQFLVALLEHPGEVVSREELARRLWSGALVDFDSGLNTAARKLRDALDDDAATPRYVETLPRRGYRFIAAVQTQDLDLAGPAQVPETKAEPVRPPAARRQWQYLVILSVAGILVLLPLYRLSAPIRPLRVLEVVQLTQTGRGEISDGVVTDGSRVYFTERTGGRWSLAQVSVHGGIPQPLASAEPLIRPDIMDISPDHTSLLVATQHDLESVRPVWVIPTVGGTPRRLGDVLAQAGAWSRDGSRVAFARGSALFLVNNDGTGCRKLVDTPGLADGIRWAPAGPDVLRLSIINSDMRARALWEVNSDGTGLHLLLRNWRPAAGLPDGETSGTWLAAGKHYLFKSRRGMATSIWSMTAGGGLLRGGSRPVQIYSTPQEVTWLAAAPDGKRIFFAASQERRELVRYDSRRGQFLPFLPGIAGRWVNFSKDARWVAYTVAPQEVLWRSRPNGSERMQLTPSSMHALQPDWSPDGASIAFNGAQIGQNNKVYTISPAGGAPEAITQTPFVESDPTWSPDGTSLAFGRVAPAGVVSHVGLYVMDWKTRQTRFLPGSDGLGRAAWSPDPRYLAATDGARMQLLDFKTGQWTHLASGTGLGPPLWSRDARYVYFQEVMGSPEQPIFRVDIHTRKIAKMMGAGQIPQSNLTGYVMTGMGPGDEPIATVLRSNCDVYALDLELP